MAVKSQRVCKTIVAQKADKALFAFSAKKKLLPLAELKKNLATLMEHTTASPDGEKLTHLLKDPSLLEYKFITQQWEEDGTTKLYDGYIIT